MTTTPVAVQFPGDFVGRGAQVHAGTVVNIRLTPTVQAFQMVAESVSPPLMRTVARHMTIWIEATAPTDQFRLEICYKPAYDVDNVFDPSTSSWGQVGQQVTAPANLVLAQTLDDMGFAVRVVRVDGAGTPTPGDFTVFGWALKG